MPRRLLLAILPSSLFGREKAPQPYPLTFFPRIPSTQDELNPFAMQYNVYAEMVRSGQVDLKQWARVVRAWERMTR